MSELLKIPKRFQCWIECSDCYSNPNGCEMFSEWFDTEAEAIEWGEHQIDDCPPWHYTVTDHGAADTLQG